ncbi:MAG: glycosyltransferase N-terminal domain-containing protein [Phycisphaerales bacterium]|jgi:3-deoxy-D-manno-octulosonic-acid transferase|nr:glycosyltransferase N-terminal domain-containing protein [Phycisphaerales bacterium]
MTLEPARLTPLDAAYALAGIATAPVWMRKARGGWDERFGKGPALGERRLVGGVALPRIMLHAVSVGEVSALRTLVPLLADRAVVVVSASTDTGIARARARFESSAHVVRYPRDFSWSVRRFLDRVRPDVVGLVELEIWPQFVRSCARRGVPVCVINGRLSARSFKGYRRVRGFIGRDFASLTRAMVQDEDYRERFVAMGVAPDRCVVSGSMKWDAPRLVDAPEMARNLPEARSLAAELGIDLARPLIVAGSTSEGEEALLDRAVREACPPGTQLLVAPRRPERFAEVRGVLAGCTARSERTPAPQGQTRYVLDTIGELSAAYALAEVVIVGRSLMGDLHGSDPIEPAALGRPVLAGPEMGDFAQSTTALTEARALRRTTPDTLASDLAGLLGDAELRAAMGEAGLSCVRAQRGASAAHASALLEIAGHGAGRPIT